MSLNGILDLLERHPEFCRAIESAGPHMVLKALPLNLPRLDGAGAGLDMGAARAWLLRELERGDTES